MTKAMRGNIAHLNVNFVRPLPATKSFAATTSGATALSINLCSIPVLPVVVASQPSRFGSEQSVQPTSDTHRQRRNPHSV